MTTTNTETTTTQFSLISAALISFFTLIFSGLLLLYTNSFSILLLLGIGVPVFITTYFLIQYRVQKYISNDINTIYEELDMTENIPRSRSLVNTDMNTLKEKVRNYATTRNREIETLKGQDVYRKEFLGNISHELKTPLFTIQGYILTLLDGAKDKPELCEKYLNRASKGVERLEYIINDLDLITKLEINDLNLEIENFDIVALIQNIFEMLEIKASKKNITLMLDRKYDPIYVTADAGRIRQVLVNLIINSLKYGHENGTTEISIEELIDSKMIVRVTDNGEGIKKENIARLFERFYRVDTSRSRDEGGSGLGLAIVKHIIEAHQEQIYVESVYGIGSEFSFTIEKASTLKEKSGDELIKD